MYASTLHGRGMYAAHAMADTVVGDLLLQMPIRTWNLVPCCIRRLICHMPCYLDDQVWQQTRTIRNIRISNHHQCNRKR